MKFYKIFSLLIVAMAIAGTANAQVTSSPYSKIGYGILSDNASGIQRSMGGVGYAMQDGRAINVMNPASYSQVDSLTFIWDVGLDATYLMSKEGTKKGDSFGGGLDYLKGQFKIAKRLGGSFGLLPYSSVGYSFGNTLGSGSEYHEGSGGLLQLYVGAGYELFKGLSVGANGSYMFGTISNINSLTTSSNTLFLREMQVRDYNVNVGIQYAYDLDKDSRIVVGATFTPKKSFHGNTWGLYYDNQDAKADTVGMTKLNGKFEQPNTFGVGLSYNYKKQFLAEVDFTYQDWAKAKYTPIAGFEAKDTKFNNRWKAAAGVQYTPNKRGSYLGVMKFRVGGFYNNDYMNIAGNSVKDYGVSAGVGLPVPGVTGKTTLNLGIEWKRRQASPQKLIQEDYLSFTVGINVNEVWFWKNKIR
ncbi:MAG: hypothetical protein KBT09_09575 [Bacteroidales bacterium]|nr:hypothetical protein [Candidatus Sodaliphilus fimicaballi]